MTGEPTYNAPPAVAEAAPRATLVVHAGPKAGMKIPCRRIVTLIGSRAGCKINLRHAKIAPVHTAIVNNGEQVIAVDLAAAKGTKLNGLKMDQEPLSQGDLLELGAWEFRVELKPPKNADSDDAHPFELDQSPEAVALEHLDTGRVLKPNREICVIGRRSGCDIHIEDDRVSRAHVLLLRYFGFPAVCDLLSNSGTSINDEPVSYRMLKDNDVLTIGDTRFRVRLLGSQVGRKQPAGKPAQQERSPADTDKSGSATGMIQLEDDSGGDMIDIHTVESSQRWHVADQAEKLSRKA